MTGTSTLKWEVITNCMPTFVSDLIELGPICIVVVSAQSPSSSLVLSYSSFSLTTSYYAGRSLWLGMHRLPVTFRSRPW